MVDYDNLTLWYDGDLYDYDAGINRHNYCRFVYEPGKTSFYKIVTDHNIPDGCDSVNIKSGTIMEYKKSEIAGKKSLQFLILMAPWQIPCLISRSPSI
mgnify:CR=1 FL=1